MNLVEEKYCTTKNGLLSHRPSHVRAISPPTCPSNGDCLSPRRKSAGCHYSSLHKYAESRKKILVPDLITNKDPRTLCLHESFFLHSVHCLPLMFGEDADIISHSFETKLSIQLTLYTNKTVAGSKKSKKKTESKAKKTKEATFTLSSNNHLEFLQCLLIKHGQNTYYKVTEHKRFGFKYLFPVSKAYVCHFSCFDHYLPFLSSERDAIDVENATDYREMVANLANFEPDKIKILMDMKVIRSSCGRAVSFCIIAFESCLTIS